MAGLVLAIHVFTFSARKTWMPVTSTGMTIFLNLTTQKTNSSRGKPPMAYETIKYEVDEQILTITLNRPDKLNAFNAAMQRELIEAFDAADNDDNVRAIIVTGAGRGFCAGAALSS